MKKIFLFIIMAVLSIGITVNAKEVENNLTLESDITDGIHIPEGKTVVLDLNDHNITGVIDNYATIYNEGTLTIKGFGKVTNNYSEETDPALILNTGTIVIENGTYKGGSYPLKNEGKATLKGGSFEALTTFNSIQNNKSLTIENGTFNTQLVSNDTINVKNGTFNRMVTVVKKGTIEDGKFTVLLMADGEGTILNIKNGTFSQLSSKKATTNVLGGKTSGQVQAIEGGVVNIYDGEYSGTLTVRGNTSKILASGGVFKYNVTRDYLEEGFVCRERSDSKYIVLNPDNISLKMITNALDALADEEEELVGKVLAADYQIGKSYDVTIKEVTVIQGKEEELGNVTETEEELEVTLEIPEELQDIPSNTEREYTIVRIHDGEAQELETTNNNDGTLTAKSNLFSTYIVAYKDTVTSGNTTPTNNDNNTNTNNNSTINHREDENIANPKTKDDIILYVILLSVSSITLLFNTKKLLKNN